MNLEDEKLAAQLGLGALADALEVLGLPGLGQNPYLRFIEPMFGTIPRLVVEKPGVVPIQFTFAFDLDIWVDSLPEVFWFRTTETNVGEIRDVIVKIFQSNVTVTRKRWSDVISMQIAGSPPWRHCSYVHGWSRIRPPSHFEPFAPPAVESS